MAGPNRVARQLLEPWERRFGCCAAISLGVLEVKRLLLLTLEVLLDSRPIRFAGALVPIVLSFADAGLGFPVAIAAVYAIRRHRARPCYPRRGLRRVTLMLLVCVLLNAATLLLIGYRVSVRTESLGEAFRASMRLYASKAAHKLGLDELQLELECCGALAYSDWFGFDWQAADYEDAEDRQGYGQRSVPFSCCRKRTMLPCAHTDMRRENLRTINGHGCALVLSGLLLKIVVVGYSMTGLIIVTQIVTIALLLKIIQKMLPELCPSDCSCCESACLMNGAGLGYSSDERMPYPAKYGRPRTRRPKTLQTPTRTSKFCRRPRTARKVYRSTSSKLSSPQSAVSSSWSSDSSATSGARLTSSPSREQQRGRVGSARIAPSVQLQHILPPRHKRGP